MNKRINKTAIKSNVCMCVCVHVVEKVQNREYSYQISYLWNCNYLTSNLMLHVITKFWRWLAFLWWLNSVYLPNHTSRSRTNSNKNSAIARCNYSGFNSWFNPCGCKVFKVFIQTFSHVFQAPVWLPLVYW